MPGAALLVVLLAIDVWAVAPTAPSALLPLSAFGLTTRSLLALGFTDSDQGLFELSTARWYAGEERERKLAELTGRSPAVTLRPAAVEREPLKLPAFDPRLPELDAARLDGLYDGSQVHSGGHEAVAAAPSALVVEQLAPSSRPATKRAAAVVPPVSVGGLQARGSASELARLAARRFPGAGVSDLAAAGTQAAWQGAARLVERYAQGARLPRPGWEQELAQAYREGFTGRWEGDKPIHVTVTEDQRLFAHRGLWVGNPVLERPDGSVELVLNLPWMQTIAQDGAFADARLVKVRDSLAALDGAERTELLEGALGGRDPQAMTYGLLYRLAGWMQADLIRSSGADPDAARGAAAARIEGHPVWRAIYEGALNAAVSLTRGLGAGTTRPDLWKPASDEELWRLVREANAGSGSSSEAVAERLERAPELVGYAQYLDLGLEPNRLAVRRVVAAAPRACRLSGRLAQAGDAAGIAAFARDCLGTGAEAFLAELHAFSSSDAARAGYRAFLEDLIQSRGERGWPEMAGRRRVWLASLAEERPGRAASLWDAAPEVVRKALVAALAASPSEGAAAALAALEGERPEAAAARAALSPGPLAVEGTIRRAALLPAPALEAAGETAARRFQAQPQSFVRLLKEPAVVAPILDAAGKGGVDAEFLAAVAFQEGYLLYAERLSRGEAAPSFDSSGPMGLDSFGELADTLKRRGYLRRDFDAFEPDGAFFNEADHRLKRVRFKDAGAAMEALASLTRYKRAQFLTDAKALGLETGALSREELELWTYVYFNYRDPRSVLKRGLGEVRRFVGPSHPLYSAQRVGATAAYLRDLRLFRGE